MEKASKKPGLKKASGLGSSAPHVVPNKPLQMQKRKREHDGEGSESMRKGGKRTKMVHNQSDIAQADQTKGAEKAQVAPLRGPGDGKGNGDEVLEAQNMKRIETSDTKLAKRERRKRKRESKAVQEFDDGKDQLARTKSAGNLTEESQQFGKDTALVEKKHNKEEQSTKNESSWKMSEPIGGSFIDAEPLFSVDEK